MKLRQVEVHETGTLIVEIINSPYPTLLSSLLSNSLSPKCKIHHPVIIRTVLEPERLTSSNLKVHAKRRQKTPTLDYTFK